MGTLINKILVVDDEEEFADIISRQLTAAGMSVTTASNAEQALELARAARLVGEPAGGDAKGLRRRPRVVECVSS